MVFGLFSKERALNKAIAKATNKLAQSADRWAAMEKLRENGSEEALLALCKRFSFTASKTIEDQQEKQWTVESLKAAGPAAYEPIRKYMLSATALGYPLEILGQIVPKDKVLKAIDEVFAKEEPGYTRDPKKRIDMIEWLAEWEGAEPDEVAERITPYLEDFDENVRFKVTEAISQKPSELAGPPLAKALTCAEEESKRLKERMAEVLCEHKLELGEHKDAVARMLEEELRGYKLVKNRLKKKGS